MSEVEFKIGEGYISGYLSAFLGLLSFGGVLCFLFPEYLTTADLRASYNINYLRILLLVTLSLTFVFGAINLPVIDMLFGTFYMPKGIIRQLIFPFSI